MLQALFAVGLGLVHLPAAPSTPSRSLPRLRCMCPHLAWAELITDEGERYYHNEESGITQWEKPEGFAVDTPLPTGWSELLSDEGEPYYYNEESGQVTWVRPAASVSMATPSPLVDPLKSLKSSEQWLIPAAQGLYTMGESIQRGDVVLSIPEIASASELEALLAAGQMAANAQVVRAGRAPASGRYRFSVSDTVAFDSEVVLACEELLLRVLDRIDEQIPSVYETLFQPGKEWAERQPLTAKGVRVSDVPPEYLAETCPSLRELYMAGELEWSEGEPAINVYTEAGSFGTHQDHMALTVLLPLTPPTSFEGGGTGFWSHGEEQRWTGLRLRNSLPAQPPEGPPTTVIKPLAGAALVFGGDVFHAGMPVESGLRSVFVASFSTRTPSSPEDRVNGLQPAVGSSSLREYSTER